MLKIEAQGPSETAYKYIKNTNLVHGQQSDIRLHLDCKYCRSSEDGEIWDIKGIAFVKQYLRRIFQKALTLLSILDREAVCEVPTSAEADIYNVQSLSLRYGLINTPPRRSQFEDGSSYI